MWNSGVHASSTRGLGEVVYAAQPEHDTVLFHWVVLRENRSPFPSPKDFFLLLENRWLTCLCLGIDHSISFFLVHSVLFPLYIQLALYFWKVFLSYISKFCFFSFSKAQLSALGSHFCARWGWVSTDPVKGLFLLWSCFPTLCFSFVLLQLCCVLSGTVSLRCNYSVKFLKVCAVCLVVFTCSAGASVSGNTLLTGFPAHPLHFKDKI